MIHARKLRNGVHCIWKCRISYVAEQHVLQEKVDKHALMAALKACGKSRDIEGGTKLHLAAEETGQITNIYVATATLDMYAKCGNMYEARKLFNNMAYHDTPCWNTLILGYVDNGENELALELFWNMQSRVSPNPRSFLAALMACVNLAIKETGEAYKGKTIKQRTLDKAMSIHQRALGSGCLCDLFVATTLVDVYAKCGDLTSALRVFNQITSPNVVSWTVAMLGCVENAENSLAMELFERMDCPLDARAFVAALSACVGLAEAESAAHYDGMFLKVDTLKKGMAIHSAAVEACLVSDHIGKEHGKMFNVFVASRLVDMYAKCGSMHDARSVFDRMPYHDLVLWTALILGYAENKEYTLALELFSCVRLAGFEPDSQAYVGALVACNGVAALVSGMGITQDVLRLGFETDPVVMNCLVDFYGKCGSTACAQHLFDSSHAAPKNSVSWNSLISGYSHQGETQVVFDLFKRMVCEGVCVTAVTFLCVITACSHAGLVDRGESLFGAMREYGVEPDLQHYVCMVDLFGRSNKVEMAWKTLQSMPFEADAIAWTTLLSSCRKWRNVEIGRVAFENLLRFDEKQGAYYVLMANLYGSVGMWEDRAKVLRMRKASRAWKQTGQSWWSDDGGFVHRFVARDSVHPQIVEINAKLQSLLVDMKQHGYVVSDDKEEEVCGHSERLAIGCALINTQAGTRVRIVKNLRVCDDCHVATAVISGIEKREIVCRDASRFHVFKDGKCSCNDFW